MGRGDSPRGTLVCCTRLTLIGPKVGAALRPRDAGKYRASLDELFVCSLMTVGFSFGDIFKGGSIGALFPMYDLR